MKLSCEKITVDFVGLRALDQVSLSLKTKEIYYPAGVTIPYLSY